MCAVVGQCRNKFVSQLQTNSLGDYDLHHYVIFSVPMQLQASGPQADFAPSAGGLRGPVLPDVLEEAEPDLPGSRADLLQGQALAGPAQTHGSRLQFGAHQGAAG